MLLHRLVPINTTGLNTFHSEVYLQSLILQRAFWICSAIQQAPPAYPLGQVGNGDMGNVTHILPQLLRQFNHQSLMIVDRMTIRAPACRGTRIFAHKLPVKKSDSLRPFFLV